MTENTSQKENTMINGDQLSFSFLAVSFTWEASRSHVSHKNITALGHVNIAVVVKKSPRSNAVRKWLQLKVDAQNRVDRNRKVKLGLLALAFICTQRMRTGRTKESGSIKEVCHLKT